MIRKLQYEYRGVAEDRLGGLDPIVTKWYKSYTEAREKLERLTKNTGDRFNSRIENRSFNN